MCNKMSEVRLSNASPTVERVDARQPDSTRSVRRVLFGTPDPEETRRQAEALQQQAVDDFTERYNFDPVEDRPLSPGEYDWQEDGDAPEFYRRPPRGSRPPSGEAAYTSNGSRKRPAGNCSEDCTSQKKKSHSDEDDDDKGAGSQRVQRASRPEEEDPSPPVPAQ
ncbi:cyclin-dependent kinase inhibitor 1Ba [Cyprinodon tularosa]|uniref:Cyclin-dependent kinase inhibitor 1B n=1 Tax=Cyprinodon variegatus TaxID=28743 RepID=A0A3Q2GI30_CYPVA|nr:PREDICTED: cyclin-dependent kinase inhibitor 1B-like [Cyprinodon variegatus]XP_038130446.1 cyclin-dependent kinase inhibitor 1Ba [Cyprinodon tularosa]